MVSGLAMPHSCWAAAVGELRDRSSFVAYRGGLQECRFGAVSFSCSRLRPGFGDAALGAGEG